MKKNKKTELKAMTAPELQAMERSLSHEVFGLRNLLSVERKLDKPHLLRAKRHERARVLTLLTQKQNGAV